MIKFRPFFAIPFAILLAVILVLTACGTSQTTTVTAPPTTATVTTTAATTAPSTTAAKPITLYIGGTFALTGAYAEDCAAVLAGFQDYAKYINDNHIIAPWYTDKKIPSNINFEVLWGDDQLAADKALTIYDDLKSKGLLVERITGSPEGLALKDRLNEDRIGATSQSCSPAYLSPPQTIFTNAPIYTDQMAAVAEWFLAKWKAAGNTAKPRVAYLTADSSLGRGIVIPEMQAYLEKLGYEFAGSQFVPMVPTTPPTTQLLWLKDNKVDLTLGCMINPGSQPTIKEAVRLGMGPDLAYKITFAFAYPAHLQVFVPAMGDLGNGVVVAGDFCAMDADVAGVKFANDLQNKYRPDKKVTHVMYLDGIIEAMIQVEALRLAMLQKPADKLTSLDVLEYGFFQIKNFSVGDITISPFTYGPGDVEGVDTVRLQQVQGGKIVELGSYPLRHIYKHE
ncbi:MAG: ABC transporter substrate-binding protein [Dehalococcoidales bacterium]